MKKKIWIGVIALVVIVACTMGYLAYRNYSLSPRGTAELTSGNLTTSISYCRPSVRGRLIFGESAQGALQPFGRYWRLGANESTEITFNQDVLFNDQPVKKGTYRMYAVPGKDEFEISLNTETGKWGYAEPDYTKDVLKTKVSTSKTESNVEMHTITLTNAQEPNAMNIVIEWADTRLTIPVKAQ